MHALRELELALRAAVTEVRLVRVWNAADWAAGAAGGSALCRAGINVLCGITADRRVRCGLNSPGPSRR